MVFIIDIVFRAFDIMLRILKRTKEGYYVFMLPVIHDDQLRNHLNADNLEVVSMIRRGRRTTVVPARTFGCIYFLVLSEIQLPDTSSTFNMKWPK